MVLISCSDNSSDPSYVRMLPDATGNYWIYDHYFNDSTGNQIADTMMVDSTVIEGSETILNRKAIKMATYSKTVIPGSNYNEDYQKAADILFSQEKDKLYIYSKSLFGVVGMDYLQSFFPIDEKWLLMVNKNDDYWKVHEQDIAIPGVPFSGSMLITCEKGNPDQIDLKNGTLTAQEYIMVMTVNGNFTFGNNKIPLDLKITVRFWITDGIGIIRQVDEPFSVNLIFDSMDFYGDERILSYYKLK